MANIIEIRDLTFGYSETFHFNQFNLSIREGSFTTIVGPNGSGKSTLLKLLLGLLKTDSYLSVCGLVVEPAHWQEIRKQVGVVFENPDHTFVAETVADEIAFTLENLEYSRDQIKKQVEKIAAYLQIEALLARDPHQLSGGEKQMVALASALVLDPKILFLDEALTMIDPMEKLQILKLLQRINQEKKITIVNITHDMEETTYGTDIVLMNQGTLIKNGPIEELLQDEKLFIENGLCLPFLAELSLKLQYYGLVDHVILDMNEMVNHLWK